MGGVVADTLSTDEQPAIVALQPGESPTDDGVYVVVGPSGYRFVVEIDSRDLDQPYVFETGFEHKHQLQRFARENTFIARIHLDRVPKP